MALAAAASIAVDSSRLDESDQRRQRSVEISSRLATDLLGGMGPVEALEQVAGSARAVAGAELGCIVVPDHSAGDLRVAAAAGEIVTQVREARISAESSMAAAVMASGRAESVLDAGADPRCDRAMVALGWRCLLLVPLASSDEVLGVLVVANSTGGKQFDGADIATLTAFAAQAALILALARSRDDRDRLVLLEDRDRIARDLHDLVIQRLFAVGLGLQGTTRLAGSREVEQRLASYVTALDDTVREIRQAIFSLRPPPEKGHSLRQEVIGLVREATEVHGFESSVRFDGPVDSAVPTAVAAQATAVLREALTNIGRHSGAARAWVELVVTGTAVRLTVRDDGVGIPAQRLDRGPGSGLGNLGERADHLGGRLDVRAVAPRGTELVWQVPFNGIVSGPPHEPLNEPLHEHCEPRRARPG